MRTEERPYLSEEWWLNWSENVADGILTVDTKSLLASSPADREVLERLTDAKRLVKLADESALPEDGRFYDRLHAKIMKAVDETVGSEKVASSTFVERSRSGAVIMDMAALAERRRESAKRVTR